MSAAADVPASAAAYDRIPRARLAALIRQRKLELNAVILGHNYQRAEIQEVSDFVGDSLGLSQAAADTAADVIVFCGVHFMAETAKILSPQKLVLMPDLSAGCPMSDFVTAPALQRLKRDLPEAVVVTYVNSTAEVKAESDICCTSSNAVQVVSSVERERPIIFVPDRNLARFVAARTGRAYRSASTGQRSGDPGEIVAWEGYCYVHDDLVLQELAAARKAHPDAKVVIHPEARRDLLEQADFVVSTSGMARIAERFDSLIIGTERGLIDRLQERYPAKAIVPLSRAAICGNMKVNTLAKLAWSLDHRQHEVRLAEDVRSRAERAIRGMLAIAGGWQTPAPADDSVEREDVQGGCGCG